MGKGWRNESRRHSLASRGIKTAQNINPRYIAKEGKIKQITPEDVPEDIKREIVKEANKYQGWTNRSTWALKLWIDNDQKSYQYWSDQAKKLETHDLIDDLKEWYDNLYEDVIDGKDYVNNDMRNIVRDTGHPSEVDYYSIARALKEENQ